MSTPRLASKSNGAFFRFALLIVFCTSMSSASADDSRPYISLERHACFGECPVYKVTAFADGEVLFEGEQYVSVLGKTKAKIDPSVVSKLVARFKEIGFFKLDSSYDSLHPICQAYATDHPGVVTSILMDGRSKTVKHDLGCFNKNALQKLTDLEDLIDEELHTERWILGSH